MTNEELKQLAESNVRRIQAILDGMIEDRRERQELREGMFRLQERSIQLQDAVERLVNVQEGMANLLASLDEDRPTVLRKLTAIENKVDKLLEEKNKNQ